ncbi:MAG: MFS transporter [Spirochaetia bacterium]|jgi:EmrB/QacA subfamily drug resistance transporter
MKNTSAPAASHKYVILVIVLVGVLMSVLDGIVVSIALPTITGSFNVDISSSQWTITAYMLTLTSLLLVFGRVAEFTGRSLLFVCGLAVFTLASLACGLSATLGQLVAFRVVQGIGGAMVFSISGAILFLAFPQHERGRAMGYLGSTVAVGSILGPVLGGLLVDTLGWRSIFLINLPIGILLVVGCLFFLRTHEERAPSFQMDWVGAATLAAALLFLMLFLASLERAAASPLQLLSLGVLFLAAGAGFLLRESRCARPLLDLAIFRTRGFLLPVLAMMLFFVANFMINVVGPFYFEGVMGFRPTQVGLMFLVVPVVMVGASPLAGWLYDRRRWRHYGTIGMAVVALCFIVMGILARSWYSAAALAVVFVFLGLGSALFQSPNSTEVMNSLPHGQTAIASSVSAAVRNLGMTLGVALASLLLPLQLRLAGAGGNVLTAPKGILASAIGNIMLLSAALCIITVVVLARNRLQQAPAAVPGAAPAATAATGAPAAEEAGAP